MDINAVKERIAQLENAIKRLDSVKKHLSRSATDTKAQIHVNVSRNLECLRGREMNLLGHVDQVMGVKESALNLQQARLNQALGVLQTSLTMVQEDSATDKQLVDTLEKLNRVELSPEETPYITFKGDHIGLRDTILNYGRVDANGLPLVTAFDDPGNPSASLPRHVEEYEDQDHHVFYKTVQEVKGGKGTAPSITVTIPKLSNRLEDWLQKKTTSPVSKAVDSAPCKPSFSPVATPKRPNTLTKSGECPSPIRGLSRTSTPGSSCSLNNWLSLIKQHADLEEEHDFEIVDNSLPPKAPAVITPPNCDSKVEEVQKDLKQWLRSGTVSTAVAVSDFFKHISTDRQVWLLQSQLRSLEQTKQSDFFRHISKEPSTWLRSRAYSKVHSDSQEQDSSDFFSHIPRDVKFWLSKKNSTVNNTADKNACCKGSDCDDTKWLLATKPKPASTPAVELEDVCRANEFCESFSACVSQPGCLAMKKMETSDVKNPLDPTQVFKPLDLPESEWLHPSRRENKVVGDEAVKMVRNQDFCTGKVDIFRAIPSIKDSIWLLKPASSTVEQPSLPFNQKGDKDETNFWLQKVKPEPVQTGPESSVNKFSSTNCNTVKTSASDLADWLLIPSRKDEKEGKKEDVLCDEEEKESEGWSVVSDNYSISSDQHAVDVAAADYFINKWLL